MYQPTPYEKKMLQIAYKAIAALILIGTALLSCDSIEAYIFK
jgi:hypothetical protein